MPQAGKLSNPEGSSRIQPSESQLERFAFIRDSEQEHDGAKAP